MTDFKPPLPLTEPQAKASDPRISAFVSASAGTGKTHVLTARVLRALLMRIPPEEILCLTFTKAAASEMTNRLFKELGGWLSLDDAQLALSLKRRCDINADLAMLDHARSLFARVIDLPDGIAIQTFHSFCQSLLGRFPLEAGMTPGFRPVDEAEAKSVMNMARGLALGSETHDSAFKRAIATVAVKASEDTFDTLIRKLEDLKDQLSRLVSTHAGADGIAHAIDSYLGLDTGLDAQTMAITYWTDLYARRADALRPATALYAAGSTLDQETSVRMASVLGQPLDHHLHDPVAALKDWQLIFLTKDGTARTRSFPATKKTIDKDPALMALMAEEQTRVHELATKLALRDMADMSAALVALGERQLNRYRDLKDHEGLVDFDDMVARTVAMFDTPGIADWVLFKLDHKISHILVDEAQDTNRAQWAIVEALANEFFAGIGARDTDTMGPRSVFAVGDDKQSIFSFQGADPKEFDIAQDRLTGLARAADLAAEKVDMNTSFRSSPVILDLVDRVFANERDARLGLTAGSTTIRHDTSRKDAGGVIELWPIEKPEKQDAPEPWQPPIKAQRIEDTEVRAAKKVANRIAEMVKGAGPIRAGDILILMRRRREIFIETVTARLKSYGVEVAGRDRMQLSESLAAMDLIALGRAALLPDDDLTLATVLKGPMISLSEEDLFTLAYDRQQQSLYARLVAYDGDSAEIIKARSRFIDLTNDADVHGPFEFFADILGPKGGRQQLIGQLGGDSEDTIDIFLEAAHTYQLQKTASLMGFLDHVQRSDEKIKRDPEAAGDRVRIMTTHGAKGLEAPIVFLTDVIQTPGGNDDAMVISPSKLGETKDGSDILLWTTGHSSLPLLTPLKEQLKRDQMAEYRRLLYVALTRARDQLYVVGWQGMRAPKPGNWHDAIQQGLETMDGITELDDGTLRLARSPFFPARSDDETTTHEDDAATDLPDWLFQPPQPEPVRGLPISPSKLDQDVLGADVPALSPIAETVIKPATIGTHLHALMQWLGDLAPDKASERARAYLAEPARRLTVDEQKDALSRLETLLDNARDAGLFAVGSRAEVTISGQVGDLTISGRLDRLLIANSEIVFCDFKSGEYIPKDRHHLPDSHVRQMALYRALLGDLYPDRKLSGVLVYAEAGAVFTIPDQAMDAAFKAVTASAA